MARIRFDLYWALLNTDYQIDPAKIIESFLYYMEREETTANREEFVGILEDYLAYQGFLTDMAFVAH